MAAEIGVALLGHGFMGRAHAEALRAVAAYEGMALRPRLVAVAGRDAQARGAMARRYGIERDVGDWRELLTGDVGLFENLGPNALHAEPTIAAAQAGKHVLCEKPLGRDAAESERIAGAVAQTGVVAMCAFNYRFVPAVRLARELLESGDLGEIHHARFAYLQAWGAAADESVWRFDSDAAGSGALGDLASHVVDLARYLVGEPVAVSGAAATFKPGREVDDAVAAAVEFAGGALGTFEATRYATGNANRLNFEINGARGALRFDLERLNELEVADAHGFRRILVTEPGHPFAERHWPHGHIVGWADTFAHELAHMLEAIAGEHAVGPHGATFEDGHRAAVVCDAIMQSAREGRRVHTAPAAA
jgi:predicted dehydrogenase